MELPTEAQEDRPVEARPTTAFQTTLTTQRKSDPKVAFLLARNRSVDNRQRVGRRVDPRLHHQRVFRSCRDTCLGSRTHGRRIG